MQDGGARVLVLGALLLIAIFVPACSKDSITSFSSSCQPKEGPVRSVTLDQGSATATVDVDKVLPVIVRMKSLGRPRVLRGSSVLEDPTGPYHAVGGGRQFNFVPKRSGTATIVAKDGRGASAQLIVHVVCP